MNLATLWWGPRNGVTLGALRQARANHRAEQARVLLGLPDPAERETITHTARAVRGTALAVGDLVLVVRFHHGSRSKVELFEDRWARLLHQSRSLDRSRVVEPLPMGKEQYVHVRVHCQGQWVAWIQPADTVPVVHDHVASRGSFVFQYVGGPARVQMTHTDQGDFSLTQLTPDFEQGPGVLSGTGISYAEGHLSGPTYLHVRAKDNWKITIT